MAITPPSVKILAAVFCVLVVAIQGIQGNVSNFCNEIMTETQYFQCPNPDNFSIGAEYVKPKTEWHLNLNVINPFVYYYGRAFQ